MQFGSWRALLESSSCISAHFICVTIDTRRWFAVEVNLAKPTFPIASWFFWTCKNYFSSSPTLTNSPLNIPWIPKMLDALSLGPLTKWIWETPWKVPWVIVLWQRKAKRECWRDGKTKQSKSHFANESCRSSFSTSHTISRPFRYDN